MDRSDETRHVTLIVGFLMGSILGTVLFFRGCRALFVMSGNEDLLTISTVMASAFTLLPLSILGRWKPRIAAYAIMVSSAWVLIGTISRSGPVGIASSTSSEWVKFLLFFVLPQMIVAGLLFHASRRTGA